MSQGPGKAKRGLPSKEENFNEWYPFIVEAAELVDKRYPIKGMDVWRPYGWKTMKLIDALTHQEMERTNHEEVNFPLLIPENLLERENALVARLKRAREEGVDPDDLRDEDEEGGFKKEVYWVKHAGENELDIPMFLRPTSETAMYTMFPLWIRSHKDLPLKVYQMVNTFRYETKQTRSFIRVREIHFFEAHTAHADEADATRQIEQDLEIVDNVMRDLCLPVIKAKRPLWDTFPRSLVHHRHRCSHAKRSNPPSGIVPSLPRPVGKSLRYHLREPRGTTTACSPNHLRNVRAIAWRCCWNAR
jgi:prolyl-tRNA synthetase